MTLHELAILAATLLQVRHGSHVAVLVRLNDRRPEGYATEGAGGAQRAATACVQLMQAQAQQGYGNFDYYLYTTARPTAMCLGMSRRCHVTAVIYPNGNNLAYNTSADVGQGPRPLTNEMQAMSAGQWTGSEQWRAIERQADQTPGLQPIARAVGNGHFPSIRAWILASSQIPEVNLFWITGIQNNRLNPVAAPRFLGVPPPTEAHGRPQTILRDRIYILLAFALLDATRSGQNAGNAALDGQHIAAILVDPQGRLLSWGVNTNTNNSTRHGETNCLQTWLQRAPQVRVPDNSTLYTTLQSCDMCAGMLTTVARRLRVVYGAPDPGLDETALTRGLNHCWEERFRGTYSNPVARARFRWAIGQHLTRAFDRRMNEVTRTAVRIYDNRDPAPAYNAYKSKDEFLIAKTAHSKARDAYAADFSDHVRASTHDPAQDIDSTRLPRAVTGALTSTEGMRAISRYHRILDELGMAMRCRYQYHPQRDHMGFTRAELRDIVERDEARFPDLRAMTDADLAAWQEGMNLLRAVSAGALEA